MRALRPLLVLCALFSCGLAAHTNGRALWSDQLFQSLVELTAKYYPCTFGAELGALLRVTRNGTQYCQQHVTARGSLHALYIDTLYPRCYAVPHASCPAVNLRGDCLVNDAGECVDLSRHSVDCFDDERLRIQDDRHMTRVKWVEQTRLSTNQLAADLAEIQQVAERASEAKISIARVLPLLDARVTRVKESVRQILDRLSLAGLSLNASLVTEQCESAAQLKIALDAIDLAAADPVLSAVEHVILALWHVTLCDSWDIDMSALVECRNNSFSESCWASFIDRNHVTRRLNHTRALVDTLRTWYQPASDHVYYRCWSAQLTRVISVLTAVTDLQWSTKVSPNIDISIGTAISGSRDQCGYYSADHVLVEFDVESFQQRATALSANSTLQLYNVLAADSSALIALISNDTRLSLERPSEDFLPNRVLAFTLHYVPSAEVTPVTMTPAIATPAVKRSHQEAKSSQCSAGQYLTLNLGCRLCPIGSYCPGDDLRYLCSNGPRNISQYTSPGVTTERCPFDCLAGFYYDARGDTCQTVPPGYTVNPLNTSQLLLCDTILPHSYYDFYSASCEDREAKYSAVLLPQPNYAREQWVALLTIIRHSFRVSTWLRVAPYSQARELDITLLEVDGIWRLNVHLNLESQCWARLELHGVLNSAQSAPIACPDTWLHIAVEGDLVKSTISFFVNGVLAGSQYYAPWMYPPSIDADLEAKNSIYRPIFLMRVTHMTPVTSTVDVLIDNLILAVYLNDSLPYMVTSGHTLIDRWHRNPIENRLAFCQQQHEHVVQHVVAPNSTQFTAVCLPHCAHEASRDLNVTGVIEGLKIISDVSLATTACQTATSADEQHGPRSLSAKSKVSKCDSHAIGFWSARYLVLTAVNQISIAEITILDGSDQILAVQEYLLIAPNNESVNRWPAWSSTVDVPANYQLAIDLGADTLIDRVYLFLAAGEGVVSLAGHAALVSTPLWHVSIDPHLVRTVWNPRATVFDDSHRLPNQEVTCTPCAEQFGLAISPRSSSSDCQCLNLAADLEFDPIQGCQASAGTQMPSPVVSFSGGTRSSQTFALDFLFGQMFQLWLPHVLSMRDFISVSILDEPSGVVTRVKYRPVSPPITTKTLGLPNMVRTNLTVTATWHAPGHVISAPITERYTLIPEVSPVSTEPYLDTNTSLTVPITVLFRVSDADWANTEHVIVLTLWFMNGTVHQSTCRVTCQLVVTSSLHVRAVAQRRDWLDSGPRDWTFTARTDPPGLCDGYIWLCSLGFSVLGAGAVTGVILLLGWKCHWFAFAEARD